MENLDEIIEEIKRNTYDNEIADLYIRDLLDQNKEYEWPQKKLLMLKNRLALF